MTGVPPSARGFSVFIAPSPDLAGVAAGAAGAAGVAGTTSGLGVPSPPVGATAGPAGAGALTDVGVGVVTPGAGVRREPALDKTSAITRACSRGDLSMLRWSIFGSPRRSTLTSEP